MRLVQQGVAVSLFAGVLVAPTAGHASREAAVSEFLLDAVNFFCAPKRSAESILAHFAPEGAQKAGGKLLPAGTAFYTSTEVVTTLRVFKPFDFVVWWPAPRSSGGQSGPVTESHLSLDTSVRIVDYRDFVRRAKLDKSDRQTQSHPLGDIVHEHTYRCKSGGSVALHVSEIVWADPFVGKVGEIAVLSGK